MQKSTGSLDWDLMRTVLAVGRSGSLSGAARALGVKHSTVFRRLDQAESVLGVRLFERHPSGYTPNESGAQVVRAAERMEEAALGAERQVMGGDQRLTGLVRIATSELLGCYLLPSLLKIFQDEQAGIEVEVTISNRAVDLTRREADVALRAVPSIPEHLVAHLLSRVEYALFAPPDLVPTRTRRRLDPTTLPWLGFDESIQHLPNARWVHQTTAANPPSLRFDSTLAMLRAASVGLGAAAAPLFAGAQEPGLVRISPPIPDLAMNLWVAYHPELRGNARVRALVKTLVAEVPGLLSLSRDAGRTRDLVRWD